MTYLTFHLLFILPPIVLLWWLLPVRRRNMWSGIATLALIAFTYATPWDNWLVAENIWTYGPDRVLMVIGHVPIEEYAFFILQPILTGLWFYHVIARTEPQWKTTPSFTSNAAGAVLFLVFTALSGLLLLAPDQYSYLAMIMVWVSPIVALHWAVGGGQLTRNWRIVAWSVFPPTLYLGFVDRLAIGDGVWHITEATSTEIMVFGLPVEELLFFFVTNIMVVQGLLLLVWVLEAQPFTAPISRARTLLASVLQPLGKLYPPGNARGHVMAHIIAPSWAVIGVMAVIFMLPFNVPLWAQLLPLGLSAFIFGLPHGAIDHLVPGQLRGNPLSRRQMAMLIGGYLVPVVGMLAVWFVSPVAGFVFFILLTWFHWGLGDMHALLAFNQSDFLNTRFQRALAAAIRGALPMMVPLVFFPGDYATAAESIIASFGTLSAGSIAWAFTPWFRSWVLIAIAAMIIVSAITTFRPTQAWRTYVGEIVLLFIYFAVVPPFLAVGIYFCLWHATRHIARLMLIDDVEAAAIERGNTGFAIGRFLRRAMPMTVASLVILGLLYLVVPIRPDNALDLVGLYLALIAALTCPHAVVVLWMDAVQGVWRAPARTRLKVTSPVPLNMLWRPLKAQARS
ncbi:MAG: beta-carotene 15,15'-dioxygenase, Brp/Blh family [Chloroflexota bacterium]